LRPGSAVVETCTGTPAGARVVVLVEVVALPGLGAVAVGAVGSCPRASRILSDRPIEAEPDSTYTVGQ